MAQTEKILGQSYPSATTLTDIYTVPGATKVQTSTIMVCNQSASSDTFRVSVAVAGAANTSKQYLYYDVNIPGKETFCATIGITMNATDVVRVYSNNGTCSFNLFGIEKT
jgi:hypothetical protein